MTPEDRRAALVIIPAVILLLLVSYGLARAGEPQSAWFWGALGAL
jgi:hypothetical protein